MSTAAHPPVLLARRLLAGGTGAGTLVVDGDGGAWTAGHGAPVVPVEVHDRRAVGAVLRRGSNGLAESYVDGWWDTDDLTGLVRVLLRALSGTLGRLDRFGRTWGGALSAVRRVRPPSAGTDRRNVQAHYDLPGALFTSMLDETMTYSCAVFDRPESGLAEAQRAKLDRICRKLDLGPDDHVLEIGTGWGSFALHAAGVYGCRVTTTTLSVAQREVATARVAAAGLSDRVQVLGSDYRTLEGTYDKLVSVEMIEAVDWRRHDAFFATCRRLLRPEGLLLLQAIVMADASYERAKHHDDFIRRMVFPGGCIPSITAIVGSLTRATDLRVFDLEDIGRHYATTLRRWEENLEERWSDVAAAGLDERFHRLWRLYLCYCEAAFLERHISDVQLVLTGPDWRAGLSTRKI
jgi:cyclopropane-fatty-acyl-phospholipid synthase